MTIPQTSSYMCMCLTKLFHVMLVKHALYIIPINSLLSTFVSAQAGKDDYRGVERPLRHVDGGGRWLPGRVRTVLVPRPRAWPATRLGGLLQL